MPRAAICGRMSVKTRPLPSCSSELPRKRHGCTVLRSLPRLDTLRGCGDDMRDQAPNILLPGHKNELGDFDYKGPISGWFSLLHHDGLVEWSRHIWERVGYILLRKPAKEQWTRLRHIVYLGERGAAYADKLAALKDEHMMVRSMIHHTMPRRPVLDDATKAKLGAAGDAFAAKVALLDAGIIDYIEPIIGDDFRWNGEELVFDETERSWVST